MFSLLQHADPGTNLAKNIEWHTESIAPNDRQLLQEEEVSFLDRLAAPTVFLQQAVLFDSHLELDVLRQALGAVVQQYPPFGFRLTTDAVSPSPLPLQCTIQ